MTDATAPSIPVGMVEVTKEAFFAALKADSRDIMPHLTDRTYSTWETPRRDVWGWSAPGWANPGEHEPIFALATTEGN